MRAGGHAGYREGARGAGVFHQAERGKLDPGVPETHPGVGTAHDSFDRALSEARGGYRRQGKNHESASDHLCSP